MSKSTFVYAIYIKTSPERLWEALTSPEFTARYWFGARMIGDWTPGSPWRLAFADGRTADGGEVIEADRPRKLVLRWINEWSPELKREGPALCTITLDPEGDSVKLTVVHEMAREGSALIGKVGGGWPRILSNLKSLLETGEVVLGENVPGGCGATPSRAAA